MPVGHPRKQLADFLTEQLPKSWRVIPEQRTFDPQNKTCVIVKQQTIARNPAAPIGVRTVGFVLTLVSRFTSEVEQIEDDLDARLPELLAVLDGAPGIQWSTATKVLVFDTYLGYDIPVEVGTAKENL